MEISQNHTQNNTPSLKMKVTINLSGRVLDFPGSEIQNQGKLSFPGLCIAQTEGTDLLQRF